MKVRLTKDRVIGSKQYGKGSVVDLFQNEVEAIIAAGEGVAVPDGTMARRKAYGVAGCMPPAGFDGAIKIDNTPKSSLRDAIAEIEKQKTNTLKK